MALPNRSTASTFNALGKVNNANIPPANSTGQGNTDWDNPSLAVAIGDVAALGLTAPRFWCRMTLAATTGALVLNSWQAVWGNATITTPVMSRVNTGEFTIVLPTQVSDEYDASVGLSGNITVNLQAAHVSIEGGPFGFTTSSASGNVIYIYTANSSASANDLAGTTIFVTAY